MKPSRPQGPSGEKLELFVAGLSGLSPEEGRKAKLLFIKNEISELRAARALEKSLNSTLGCFGIIPFLRPILRLQRKTVLAGVTLQAEQIVNALDVWGDDLGEAEVGKLIEQVRALSEDEPA